MATLKQGILGGFSGKAGTVIGYTRKGVAYIRGLMTSFTPSYIQSLVDQRAKFGIVMKFLRPLTALLRTGFKDESSTSSGFNIALSYTIQHAIKGLSPAFEIDYSKVRICQGNLQGAMNPNAESTVAGKVEFSWDDNTWDFGAESSDKVVLVVYCPSLGKAVTVIGEATRALGTQIVTLPDVFSGLEVQTYIGFCNATETKFSNGEFLKMIAVA
jgi:hypothetical protein